MRHVAEADEVWHAGDLGNLSVYDRLNAVRPTRAVYGNIDDHLTRTVCPEYLLFTCEGLRVLMVHIGGYPGRYTPCAKKLLTEQTCDLFITGHSHVLKVVRDPQRRLLHMNPGAAGIHGFHKVRTMIRFKVQAGKVSDAEVIELGPRGSLSETIG